MRGIIFKARAKSNPYTNNTKVNNWVMGNYVNFGINPVIYVEPFKYYGIHNYTLCQLITKNVDIEIYEYDCWYYEKGNYFVYFYYDGLGLLMQDCVEIKNDVLHKNIKESTIQVTDRKVYLSCFELQFIGNWHDGQEYLLNQIKELNK
jgi:hypothetical protein